jgi:hypothetical protein
MEIIFKAKDGTMFDSAEACVRYETELASDTKEWTAWDWGGTPTDKTTNAIVVNLATERAAAQFLGQVTLENDDSIKGIDTYSQGWYYWDEYNDQYSYLDDDILSILKSISAS